MWILGVYDPSTMANDGWLVPGVNHQQESAVDNDDLWPKG